MQMSHHFKFRTNLQSNIFIKDDSTKIQQGFTGIYNQFECTMSYQAEWAKLENELQDVEVQVIQDIIDYRKAHGRASQKMIAEQFGVELVHVKRIGKFMKRNLSCEQNSKSSTMTDITDVEKDAFSSVAELNQYLAGFGDDGSAATKQPTELERMLTDFADDEEISDGSLTRNKPVEMTEGEKLIKHVQWFVEDADLEIRSLKEDAELFDAERNGFKEKNHKLSESLRVKDLEIAQLKSELATANMFHKEKVCNVCDKPKKFIVGNIRFCSIPCIKQATKDLEGADNLPSV